MKKITIISLGNETGNSLKIQLQDILKGNISIDYYSIDKNLPKDIDSDLIVFSSKEVANLVLGKSFLNQKHVIVRRELIKG